MRKTSTTSKTCGVGCKYTQLRDEFHEIYVAMTEPYPCQYCDGGKDLNEDEECGECEGWFDGPNLVEYNNDQIVDMMKALLKKHVEIDNSPAR